MNDRDGPRKMEHDTEFIKLRNEAWEGLYGRAELSTHECRFGAILHTHTRSNE